MIWQNCVLFSWGSLISKRNAKEQVLAGELSYALSPQKICRVLCTLLRYSLRLPGQRRAVIDNLVKGASGQAIQNLNVMLGVPETTGLLQQALFP